MKVTVELADGFCLPDLLLRAVAQSSIHEHVEDYVSALVYEQVDAHPDSRICENPSCDGFVVYPVLELHPGPDDSCRLQTRPCKLCPECGGSALRQWVK